VLDALAGINPHPVALQQGDARPDPGPDGPSGTGPAPQDDGGAPPQEDA
jgi:hypothetical protein